MSSFWRIIRQRWPTITDQRSEGDLPSAGSRVRTRIAPSVISNIDTSRRQLRAVMDKLGGKYENIVQPFHIMRHSCASLLAMRGVEANRIQNWMDHSSLVVTQRYMKLAPAAMSEVAGALEPIARPHLKVVNE